MNQPRNSPAAVRAKPYSIKQNNVVDTREGALGPMAAPTGCLGPYIYTDVITFRYKRSVQDRQHMLTLAQNLDGVQIIGPYATEARAILQQCGQLDHASIPRGD